MNHKAIDLSATAYAKIDVPPIGRTTLSRRTRPVSYEGKPELVEQVKKHPRSVDKMDGDSLPVSAFMPHVDGQWSFAPLTEKRGVAVPFPRDETKCIQCNNCAYVCPHATIRPFALTEEEARMLPPAPRSLTSRPVGQSGVYKYTMAISPLDCGRLRRLRRSVPVGALTMVSPSPSCPSRIPSTCVQGLRQEGYAGSHRQAASSSSPCSSSPAPAQAAPRPAMPVSSPSSSATVCTSPTPPAARPSGAAPALPLRTARIRTATARHGATPVRGQRRARLRYVCRQERRSRGSMPRPNGSSPSGPSPRCRSRSEVARHQDDGNANAEATKEYVAALQANIATVDELAAVPKFAEHAAELKAKGEKFCDCDACKLVAEILDKKDYLSRSPFGSSAATVGLRYRLRRRELRACSEQERQRLRLRYRGLLNTGGQASKASNIGQVAQFARRR